MSRAIKFRVWGGESMEYIDLYWFEENCIEEWPGNDDIPPILMQFTGLQDKNGVEIYEGDICRWLSTEAEWKPIWPIRWDNEIASFCMGPLSIKSVFESGYYQPVTGRMPYPGEGLQVIGNIYEHPELLGVLK